MNTTRTLEAWPAIDSRPVDLREACPNSHRRGHDSFRRHPTLVALVGPAADPGLVENVDDAGRSRAVRTSWIAPGTAGEAHRSSPNGSVMTCTFNPVLPGTERAVSGTPVDRQACSVQRHGCLHRRGTDCLSESWAYVIPFHSYASVSSACRSAAGPTAAPGRQVGKGSVAPNGGSGVLPVFTALAAFPLAQP